MGGYQGVDRRGSGDVKKDVRISSAPDMLPQEATHSMGKSAPRLVPSATYAPCRADSSVHPDFRATGTIANTMAYGRPKRALKLPQSTSALVAEVLMQFAEAESRRNSPAHHYDKLRIISHFLRQSKVTTLADLTIDTVERYLTGLQRSGYSPKTLQNRRAAVGRFCKWLVLHGHLASNPVLATESPKIANAEIVFLTDAEFDRALEVAEKYPAAMIALLTGARLGEIRRLRS